MHHSYHPALHHTASQLPLRITPHSITVPTPHYTTQHHSYHPALHHTASQLPPRITPHSITVTTSHTITSIHRVRQCMTIMYCIHEAGAREVIHNKTAYDQSRADYDEYGQTIQLIYNYQ